MRAYSVIVRELRVEARHGFTYWLRVLGAGALIFAVFMLQDRWDSGPVTGLEIFPVLHGILFVLVWVFVPVTTADCISREKRQGTLGLLFLTPLKASDIVIAKALAHGLRSLSLFLAVIPVLMIPVLMGGVRWGSIVFSAIILGSCFCWALGAGLLASAWSKNWIRAQAIAIFLAGTSFFAFASIIGSLIDCPLPGTGAIRAQTLFQAVFWGVYFCITQAVAGVNLLSNPLNPGPTNVCMVTFVVALFVLLVGFHFAAQKIRRTWRDEPPSALVLWLRDVFCKPIFLVKFYRKWMRRVMERNPIGWLQQRTWTGRSVTWSWVAILISIYAYLFSDPTFQIHQIMSMQNLVGFGLLVSLAATAAGSFQRERETGLLELLLVSPVKSWQILAGRLGGIWRQFALVFILWFVLWVWAFLTFGLSGSLDFWSHAQAGGSFLLFFMSGVLTLPIIGLYFSLRRRHFLSSLLWTLGLGLFLPAYVAGVIGFLPTGMANPLQVLLPPLRLDGVCQAAQIVLAVMFGIRLYRDLSERRFASLERRE